MHSHNQDMSKVLLMTDMDGTLLPSDKNILKKDMDAINRFREMGGKFTLATGRALESMRKYIGMMDIDLPAIIYNGAVIYDFKANKMLYCQEMSPKSRDIVNDVLKKFPDAACEILTLDDIYIPQNNEFEDEHIKICGVKPVYCDLKDIPDGGWMKVLFVMEPNLTPKVIEYVNDCNFEAVDSIQSADVFYELVPKNCSKGTAMKKFMEIMGMQDYTTAAMGDYDNDLQMLEFADISAAPANAQANVKAVAGKILNNTCDTGAVSEFIDYINKVFEDNA